MTITIVIMNPQTGNGAGMWMTSCPEEMVLRIWGFWKRVIWELNFDQEGRQVSRRVEFFGSLPTEILNTTRCAGGGVSIVWLQKTFKNFVSLLVSKNRSQKFIKPFVPEQQCPPPYFAFVNVFVSHYSYGIIVVMAMAIQHMLFGRSCCSNWPQS